MKTFKVELIRPAGHGAMWVVRGLASATHFLHAGDEWMLKWYNEIGVSSKNDTILHIDNGGDPATWGDREILAIYGALYAEVNTNEAIEDGDVFEIEAADSPLWHSHDPKAPTFPIPAMKMKRSGVHAVPADEATDALLRAAHEADNARRAAERADEFENGY